MWKKLSALLFEEEDLPVKVKEVKKVKVELKQEPIEEPMLVEEKVMVEAPIKPSSFGLQIDEEEPIFKDEPIVRKVYEFHPVISPIFGVTKTHVHDNIPKVVEKVPATLPKSVINTVISPIYGDLETKSDSAEYQGLSKTATIKASQVLPIDLKVSIDEVIDPKVQLNSDLETFTFEDFEDIDIEDLLQGSVKPSENKEPVMDDAHQFTLFDEDKA